MSKYVELNLVFNEVSKLGPAIFVSNLKSYRENWKVELFVRFRDYYLDIPHVSADFSFYYSDIVTN